MTLLKPLHEIVLRDVILLDATKSASALKSHWFIPLFLCRKELESLAKQFFDSIGGKTVDDLQDQFDRLSAYRRLQLLEALWKAVQIEFELKGRIGAWKIILGKDFKESPQLEEVLAAVLKHTGIKLETPEDLKTLSEYVQHKVDKFNEMFPEDTEVKESVPLIEIFYSVFNYMGESFNDEMLLIAFVAMKKLAESKILKQSNNTEDGQLE